LCPCPTEGVTTDVVTPGKLMLCECPTKVVTSVEVVMGWGPLEKGPGDNSGRTGPPDTFGGDNFGRHGPPDNCPGVNFGRTGRPNSFRGSKPTRGWEQPAAFSQPRDPSRLPPSNFPKKFPALIQAEEIIGK